MSSSRTRGSSSAVVGAPFVVVALLAVVAVLFGGPVTADEWNCKGEPNLIPYWQGTPTLTKVVPNGKLFMAGTGDDQIYVVHVWGTPYEMGYAQGELLRDEITDLLNQFMQHIVDEAETYVADLPDYLREIIAKDGIAAALDATYAFVEDWINPMYYEEMQGIANATGVDYRLILRVHMLPELVKAGCSMFMAWGESLATHQGLLQLRALDWDTSSILQKYPAVVIYHPNEEVPGAGHAFASVTWTGWITSLTGMSSRQVGVSEKHSDIPFGTESRVGYPFNFLMRDILQFDDTLDLAMQRIDSARRTCSIWLGVGDGKLGSGRIVEYSYSSDTIIDDKNVTSVVDRARFTREGCDDDCFNNFLVEDVVYWGVHLKCWNEVMREHHGMITPQVAINMTAVVGTGDLLSSFYDLTGMHLYVSNAGAVGEAGPLEAYKRQFVHLDMNEQFAVTKPSDEDIRMFAAGVKTHIVLNHK